MGPEILALTTLATTGIGAYSQIQQGKAGQEQAKAQQLFADRQADEEQAAGQRAAAEETRKAKFAQSRLMAVAGASGSGVSDPGVMDIWGDIEQEGRYNSAVTQTMAKQRADGINYQASLDRWKADSNAKIGKIGAIGTILGGVASAGGDFAKSRMSARYSRGGNSSSYRYG